MALSVSWSQYAQIMQNDEIISSNGTDSSKAYALCGAIFLTVPIINCFLYLIFLVPAVYSLLNKQHFVWVPFTYVYVVSNTLSIIVEFIGGVIVVIAGVLAKEKDEGIVDYGISSGLFSFLAAILNTLSLFLYLEYFKRWKKVYQIKRTGQMVDHTTLSSAWIKENLNAED